jgi:general L-amino acid transport system substrate-binding protein
MLIAALLALATLAARAATLDQVRARGVLACGTSQGITGFSAPDPSGVYRGLDVDVCRAVAAAVLGDAAKVRYVGLSPKARFTALQSGEVDLLVLNATWTLVRDTALGLNFAGVNYYDGQGFMVRRDLGVTEPEQLDGASICVNLGTTTELNLADWFRTRGLSFRPVLFEKVSEVAAAYDAGRCDAYTSDVTTLAAQRLRLRDSVAHVILLEVISKEPLGPVVRHGDDQWLDIVRWSLTAMQEAEELGIDSGNAGRLRTESTEPRVRRLLGLEGGLGKALGLDDAWAYRIVRQVGNYAESYERNLGRGSALNLPRGINALWDRGGIMYPMPLR